MFRCPSSAIIFFLFITAWSFPCALYASDPSVSPEEAPLPDKMERIDRYSQGKWQLNVFRPKYYDDHAFMCFLSSVPIGRHWLDFSTNGKGLKNINRTDGEIFFITRRNSNTPLLRAIFDSRVKINSTSLYINNKLIKEFENYREEGIEITNAKEVSTILDASISGVRLDIVGRFIDSKLKFDYTYSLSGFDKMYAYVNRFCTH